MTESILIGAIATLAVAMWWLIQRSDKNRERITSAFLDQVEAANASNVKQADASLEHSKASMKTADAIEKIARSVTGLSGRMKKDLQESQKDHRQIMDMICNGNGDSKYRQHGGARK